MQFSNVLMVVAVIAVALAVFNLGSVIVVQQSTGFASSDVGNASLSVAASVSINFTQRDFINWGSGAVDTSAGQFATLNSEGTVSGASPAWNTVTSGLNLTNDGNVNVRLNLSADKDAIGFIGPSPPVITAPWYQWRVSNASQLPSIVCGTGTTQLNPTTYTNVTCFDGVGTACAADVYAREVCSNFTIGKIMEIDVQVIIPQDSPPTGKQSLITATAAFPAV
ncbi:hypothetical protein HYT23_01305 [Candidatus Pacearchaeota archaeon]|nr:hypothetical protein [Candidatus Pacearchaeota archaeon]